MVFKVIENKPKYIHTVSEEETTFLSHVDGSDFYYRHNGFDDNIDIRSSNEPSDYTTWNMITIVSLYGLEDGHYDNLVPRFIFQKAVSLTGKGDRNV